MNRCVLMGAGILVGLLCPIAGRGADPTSSRDELARFALTHGGDSTRGRSLFADAQRLGCGRCHRVHAEGGDIGPDLSDVAGKFERAQLIEAVLEPSRTIVEGYRATTLATNDGRIVTGIIQQESAASLTLVDIEGRRHEISASDIAERKTSTASLMPDGLASGLQPGEFADLIAYLETLRPSGQRQAGGGSALVLPNGFTATVVARGLTGATAMEIAPDGRVFVCEQTGALRVIKDGALLDRRFVTLDVDHTWERGLIGVALDPRFATNGFVYVNSVRAKPLIHHRISRFTAQGDLAAPDSELVLLEGDDQAKLGGNVPAGHQGGAIHFGNDGKLYVAIGDQTAGAPAQRLDTFQGKLLRIDPDGAIPTDNPFSREASGKYRAIWALGLRNPFTFAIQPESGRMFINDVGNTRWEEVDEGLPGANYGWPQVEGMGTDRRFRQPIHTYPVASVTGGTFCPVGQPQAFPRRYRGKYFFMDFVKGWIKVLDPDHPEQVETFATGLTRPVDLRFAADGSLYVLLRDAWVIDQNFRPQTGSLVRIRPPQSTGGE